MLFSLIQQRCFSCCPSWLRHCARCQDTSVEETAMVFTLAPKELQSTEHDLRHPCSPCWDFLSQHVPYALSSSSDPSCIHPCIHPARRGGRDGRDGRDGREEGMMFAYNKSDFLAFASRAKIKKMSHVPLPLQNK